MLQRYPLKLTSVALAVCAALSFSVQAEEAEATAERAETHDGVERIQVRAAGLRREVVDMAGPVSVLAGDELIQRAEASIGETLKFEPGVHGNYFGPIASSPVIRGFGRRSGAGVVQKCERASGDGVAMKAQYMRLRQTRLLRKQIDVCRWSATLCGCTARGADGWRY